MKQVEQWRVVRLDMADLPEVVRLERACFAYHWTEEQFKLGLVRGAYHVLGIKDGERLLAYLAFSIIGPEMEILNLAVDPPYRRQGLGARLLAALEAVCRKKNVAQGFLDVKVSNLPAIDLYRKFGFIQCGVRRNYYPDTGEDALLFSRDFQHHNHKAVSMRSLDTVDIAGKKVLLRVDYNVPLEGERITDDTRIRESLPTIKHILSGGGALVICCHLGQPKGGAQPEFSLKPVAAHLASLLGQPVPLAPDCLGPEVQALIAALGPGQVLMLENLRFHKAETSKDVAEREAMAKGLVQGIDVYVNDAFGVAHRPNASVTEVPKFAKISCAGFLMKKEWQFLHDNLAQPGRPYVAVSGGAKVSSKLGILKNLLGKVDALIIGGAMANTFLLAQGHEVGISLVERDLLDEARGIMDTAKAKGTAIHLPVDFVLGLGPKDPTVIGLCTSEAIPADTMVLDIGPKSVAAFSAVLATAKTVVWNGPMGAFENPAFAAGSLGVAQAIASSGAMSIVGGGDTDAVVHLAGLADKFSFISTGGGSFLEFLEGKELPAFTALETYSK